MPEYVTTKNRLPENEARLVMIDLQQARNATQSKRARMYIDRVYRTIVHYYGLPYSLEDIKAAELALNDNRSGQTKNGRKD